MRERKKIHVVCSNCGHEWDTASKLRKVCCPSCLLKTSNPRFDDDQEPSMEYFNINEKGLRILDPSLATKYSPNGTIVDVLFLNPNKVWCEYDKSDSCRHVEYALGLRHVKDIFKKKGWKLP